MTEKDLQKRLRTMVSSVPPQTHHVFVTAARNGKEGIVVKKKMPAALMFAIVLAAVVLTAGAASVLFNLDWWYSHRGSAFKENEPKAYQAVMANLQQHPKQTQSGNSLVDVTVQDVSWAPEAEKLTISFKAACKDLQTYELHSMFALDTDGAYVGEGGSATVTEDGEDRAMHWLWRSDVGGAEEHAPRFGPPKDVMDDGSKRLLLFENVDLQVGGVSGTLIGMENWLDPFRTVNGDVIGVAEFHLDWLDPAYDEQTRQWGEKQGTQAEAEARIAAAQQARQRIQGNEILCTLTYRTVVYTEGMDDAVLYGDGEQGEVKFSIPLPQGKMGK